MDMKHIIRKRAVSLVLAFMMAIGCTFSPVAEFPAAADSGVGDSNAQKVSVDDIIKDTGRHMLMAAAAPSSPLGAAQGYNLVCFDTLKANADVQGKSFVGKKVDCKNGFTFGGTLDDANCSLVFGATETGNFKAGDKGLRSILVYDSGIENEIKLAEGDLFKRYDHWNSIDNLKKLTGIDLTLNSNGITKFQKQMIDLSDRLPDAAATGKVYVQNDNHDLILIGSDPDINVFNINGSNVEKSGKTLKNLGGVYIGIPEGSTAIINVSGSEVGLPAGGMYYTKVTEYEGENDYQHNKYDEEYCEAQQKKVLWNFNEATEVEFRGQVRGSVLAPKALVTANKSIQSGGSYGGNIEGQLIADSVQWDGTYEAHNFLFTGKIPKDQSQPILEKTAALTDWDKRTYDISLSVTATSKMVTTTVPSDIILVLDCSGSMREHMDYRPIAGSPETNQVYYIMVNGTPQAVRYDWSDRYEKYVWYYWDDYRYRYIIPTAGKSGEAEVLTVAASAAHTDFHNYYIEVNGETKSVSYSNSHHQWYYSTGIFSRQYLTGSETFKYKTGFLLYQFYTEYSYMDALKEAATGFVQTVSTNSPDSRIGVVSFASSAAIKTKNSDGDSLLRVGNTDSKNLIDRAIDSLTPGGYTHADDGLSKATELFGNESLYETVTTQSPRSKVVVFFTDGTPNHGDEDDSFDGFDPKIAQNAIDCAEVLKEKPYQATVYSIGVFSGLSGEELTQVENYMKQVASYEPDSTTEKRYYPVSDSKSLGDIFQTISQEAGGISAATITDVIDRRFELTKESRAALEENGASITDNSSNGTQTITWLNQKIEVKKDGNGNLLPSWTYQDIHIQAKSEFIGGNDIPTNVPEISGIRYGADRFVEFPRPTVDVKPRFYLGNTENTIFLGEAVPSATLEPFTLDKDGHQVTRDAMYCGLDPTGTFSYQWSDAGRTVIVGANDKAFPSSLKQYPDSNTHYTLAAWFTPNGSEDGTQNTVVEVDQREGKYTVNVVAGELDLTKYMSAQYPTPIDVDAQQSFVFKIERRNDKAESIPAETFYEVITPNELCQDAEHKGMITGMKKITGLKKGYYTVTEEKAWRYDLTSVTDNDETTAEAGKLIFIGRDITASDSAPKSYFGAQTGNGHVADYPAAADFTNTLTKKKWLGDTTVAVNTISKGTPAC